MEDFTKTFVKPDGTGDRKNQLVYEVCRVSMRKSTNSFVTTVTWIDFVRERFQNVESAEGRWRNWQRS